MPLSDFGREKITPWAIGSSAGGHKAIHPQLGPFDDFRHLVAQAAAHGLEVALDLAFQCSPDHPYVKQHPQWFRWRPDGSLQFAENPPKKYEDILRPNFWPNTPDILPRYLQSGGRPAFIIRLILAATLSASYGARWTLTISCRTACTRPTLRTRRPASTWEFAGVWPPCWATTAG